MSELPANYDFWKTANREDYIPTDEHECRVREAPLSALLRAVVAFADPENWPHHATCRREAPKFREEIENAICTIMVGFGHSYVFLENDEWEKLNQPNEPDGL